MPLFDTSLADVLKLLERLGLPDAVEVRDDMLAARKLVRCACGAEIAITWDVLDQWTGVSGLDVHPDCPLKRHPFAIGGNGHKLLRQLGFTHGTSVQAVDHGSPWHKVRCPGCGSEQQVDVRELDALRAAGQPIHRCPLGAPHPVSAPPAPAKPVDPFARPRRQIDLD
jgi:hypothetical protein